MKPCSKSSNGKYASRYLRLAESYARSERMHNGGRKRIIDGCIVEGKKCGNLLRARVIEPEGYLLTIASNFYFTPPSDDYIHGRKYFKQPCGLRDLYHPDDYKSLHLDTNPIAVDPWYTRGTRYLTTYYGREMDEGEWSIPTVNNLTPTSHISKQGNHLVSSDYCLDSSAPQNNYMRVLATNTSAGAGGFDGYMVFLHEAEIKRFSGEFDISSLEYYQKRSVAAEISKGVFVVVFTVGKVMAAVPSEDPDDVGGTVNLWREKLLRIDIDLKIIENEEKKIRLGDSYDPISDNIEPTLTGKLFPDNLVPSGLMPTSVLRFDHETGVPVPIPAKTAMTAYDIEVDDDGNVLVAVKYQVKVQEGLEAYKPYAGIGGGENGTSVVAYGLASWGGGNEFFNVHSKEVFTSQTDSPLIPLHGAEAEWMIVENSTSIIHGNVVRTAGKILRSAAAGIFGASLQYEHHPSLLIELMNGVEVPRSSSDPVMGIAFAGGGHLLPYRFGVDFERDFYLNSNWVRDVNCGNKASISKTAVAVPASSSFFQPHHAQVKSTDQGIMFIDGDKRRYEKVSEAPITLNHVHMTITCHQKETRGEDGSLVSAAVLIVGAYIDGKYRLCIRKGPIWEDDFDEEGYSFDRFWKVTEAMNNNFNFYFYLGNVLMSGKHGTFFRSETGG